MSDYGAMYFYGRIDYSSPSNGDLIYLMHGWAQTRQGSVGGYATNVEELMEDPTFWSDNIDNNKWDEWFYGNLRITPMGDKTFNSGMKVNFDARLSVTYNFGRYFVNAYGQFNNMRYSHQSSYGHLNDWFINTSIGIRL